MQKSTYSLLLLAGALIFSLISCSNSTEQITENSNQFRFTPGQEDDIRKTLITLKDNAEIYLTAGTYSFEKLSILGQLENITVKGDGPDKTIIDFSQQGEGGEGMRVENVTNFTIKDLQLKESAGDLLKVKECEGVQFINVHTIWEGEPEITNGGYGIYPVLCKDVLIDNCYARGASDAGIYVGQTINATVKNTKAEYNVAGIEIENTQNAKVFNCEATNNTGGLLVFDHPGLKYDGSDIKVYDNKVHNNNYKNFAPAANSATGVGNVPPGTGIMILRTSNVEVYNNEIRDNNTMSVGILSYVTADPKIIENNPGFDPIPKNIYLHDNKISKQDAFPEAVKDHELAQQIVQLHEKLVELGLQQQASIQDILYDGVVMGEGQNPHKICIKEAESTSFINMDVGNNFAQPNFDISPFNCQLN